MEKSNKYYKSGSKLLDNSHGKLQLYDCGKRGKVLHETWRIVGLYLCAMLHKRALENKYEPGVFLILDEIQRILPKLKSKSDGEYQKRIIGFLDQVIHRGRKRNYGVALATQSPLDVKNDIIDLCNTKLFFQIQGDTTNLLKEYLIKESRERLKKLQTGEAFIISKKKHNPIVIKLPYVD